MSYEVERDVKIEIIDESDGRIHEAAYSVAGLGRCATRMPEFTEEELKIDLGEDYLEQMSRAFTRIN